MELLGKYSEGTCYVQKKIDKHGWNFDEFENISYCLTSFFFISLKIFKVKILAPENVEYLVVHNGKLMSFGVEQIF